jgi:hypothetical protein
LHFGYLFDPFSRVGRKQPVAAVLLSQKKQRLQLAANKKSNIQNFAKQKTESVYGVIKQSMQVQLICFS